MTRTHANGGSEQGSRVEETPRQVIPDVTKSAEFMGVSIMAMMKAYLPAITVLFYGINMATWTLPLVALGIVMAIITTVGVFAAPSHDDPLRYMWLIIDHKTGQGVLRHE